MIVRLREVENPEAGLPTLGRWRLDDAVDGRAVEAAREELHAVAGVDDERVGEVLDVLPAVGGGEDLEGGDGLGVEDGDGPEVGVAFEPDVVRFGLFVFGAGVAVGVVRVGVWTRR